MSTDSPDTAKVAPDEPVDPRAAALANLASTSDVAYADTPLTDTERAAANEAGISLANDPDPAAVRKATAEAGTGTPAESIVPAGDTRSADEYDPETAPDRDDALAGVAATITATEATNTVDLTGNVVDLGGDLERVVIIARYNAMVPGHDSPYGPVAPYAMGAVLGDVVLVTEHEAARGEKLNALAELPADVDPDDDGATIDLGPAAGETATDEQLAAMGAKDLLAYVAEHPDQADRVVALEQTRPEDKQRKTVLALTDTGK